MLKKEVINFLKKTPPFDLVPPDDLDRLVDTITVEFYPRGVQILTQNGPACTALRVIKKGGVKISVTNTEGDEVTIDFRSEGDSFGYLSLMSGDKSRANVVTVEDTICYLIPKKSIAEMTTREPLINEFFMKSFFVNFIDKTYKEMRNKHLIFGDGDKLIYTTPVKDILSKEAVTASAGISIQEAAGIMSRQRISSLILVDDSDIPIGIITDTDLRDKVVARGLDVHGPVDAIMSPPLIRVDSFETCFEALVKMVQFNIHHLLVVEEGQLVGVITNHDFMLLQGTSPLSLVKFIENQKQAEGLSQVHAKIGQITSILFREGVKTSHILRIITAIYDRLIQRIMDLTIRELGQPPMQFAAMAYGSEGRREQTFKTELYVAIAYDEPEDIHEKTVMEKYCGNYMARLEAVFRACNLPGMKPHPLGPKHRLFGSISDWIRDLVPSLRSGDNDTALKARRFLDMRPIFGDSFIVRSLRNKLYEATDENRTYIAAFLDWATNRSSPLGFFKQFVVERSGEHKDKINIMEKGILPIVDALRILAVARNAHETSTIERLYSIAKSDGLIAELRDDLISAFEFLMHLRLEEQVRKREFSEELDDFIEPQKLSLLEKKTLKEVFQIIPRLHTAVEDYYLKRDTIAI